MGIVIPPKIPLPILLPKDWLISTVQEQGDGICIKSVDGRKVKIKNEWFDMATWNSSKKVSIASKMIDSISEMVNAHVEQFTNGVNSYSNASRSRSSEPIENLFYMPTDLFEAVDFTDMGVVEEPQDFVPRFVKGEKYSLAGVSCEGFEMPEKIYELVGIHDEYDGTSINSVIVKQISGGQDKIFTLSKNDCACMGIEYENGLQLFPKHLNWRRVKEIVPFDKNNLGTTPVSDIANTIRLSEEDIRNGFYIVKVDDIEVGILSLTNRGKKTDIFEIDIGIIPEYRHQGLAELISNTFTNFIFNSNKLFFR